MNNKLQLQRQNFYNLNYVIDFENLLTDFTVSMQKVSEAQYNFWCHLQDPLVLDYNQLDKDSKRIYERVKKTEELWKKLYEINPEYEVSVNRYVDYLRNIRNNDNLANNIVNQLNTNRSKRTLETIVLNNTLLFDPKTAILQISGSKDSLGRIVRTNQGTLNLFSYTAIELLQNSVNKIIPNIFARKHHAFMENYFATGHTRILDKKRSLFALHKNGCCFQIMLFVRPIFNHSSDALQYIGMLSSTQSDAEYILTDMNGVIDSMSQGIMAKLRLKPKLLHRFSGVNVQVLAPDLMYSYQDGNSSRGQKYKKVGGDVMLLVVPTNVRKILHDVSGSQTKKMSSKFVDMSIEQIYANLFGKSRKQITTPAEIYQSREYLASTLKVRVNCEIRDMVFSLGRNRSYSVRALKLTGVRTSHEELEAEGSLNCDSGSDFNFRSSQLVEEVKLFSAGGEEGMSKVLESTQRDQLDSFRNLINEMSERKDLLGQMSEQPKAREESKEPQRKNTEKGRQKEENSETLSRANDNESVAGTHKQHVEDSKKAAIYEVNDIEMGESLVIPRTKTKHEKETLTNLMMQQLKDARNRQKLASIATAEDEGNEEENKEVDEAQREMEELMDEALEQKVENNEEGSVSSVSTSVYDATQANYSIRNAVDEKKVPESTRNMNYMTIFMFLLLLGLAIAYYTVEMVSYRRINNDIEIITYSEDRKSALIDLNINVKLLLLIDPRYRECSFSCYDINIEGIDNSSNIQQINEEIVRAGKSLARAQSQLSIKTSSDSEKLGQKINPSNVELSCIFSNEEMPTSYNYDIWQATLELLSAALRISNMTVDQKYSNYSSMYLINENSLNSVLSSLDYSTDEIVDIIKDTRTSNMRIYLIMLIVASVATLVSTAVLIPVTKIVKKTNEKVLSFFLLLDDAEIKQYRYTCERFAQLCKNVFILISNR